MYPVRRNINTLEYPIWCPSRILAKTTSLNSDKYLIECAAGLPTSFDVNVLNHLLSRAQTIKSNIVEYKSIYLLLQELNLKKSKKDYERIQNSIDKYHKTVIYYKNNSFYIAPQKYVSNPKISFIKNTSFTDGLVVVFNETFIDLNNENFALTLSTELMREMNPYPKRLYEILIKSFIDGTTFNISVDKLIEKIPIYTPSYKGWCRKVILDAVTQLNKALTVGGSNDYFSLTEYKNLFIFTRMGN